MAYGPPFTGNDVAAIASAFHRYRLGVQADVRLAVGEARAGARAQVRPVECVCASPRRTRHERGCPRTTTGENFSAITPHTLRRTFGSYLLNKGLRLEVVSRLLGHSSTVVTERAYAELLGATIRDELLAVLDSLD